MTKISAAFIISSLSKERMASEPGPDSYLNPDCLYQSCSLPEYDSEISTLTFMSYCLNQQKTFILPHRRNSILIYS